MVDTAYYDDYNKALSEAIVESGVQLRVVSVHNYYDTKHT